MMSLKLQEEIDSLHVLDSLMDDYSNVNVELVSFMVNMEKKGAMIDYLFPFSVKYDERKAHNMSSPYC